MSKETIPDVSVSFLYDFVNKFTDTEIPMEAIKETLNEYLEDGEYTYRMDKPVVCLNVDVENQEILILNQNKDEKQRDI